MNLMAPTTGVLAAANLKQPVYEKIHQNLAYFERAAARSRALINPPVQVANDPPVEGEQIVPLMSLFCPVSSERVHSSQRLPSRREVCFAGDKNDFVVEPTRSQYRERPGALRYSSFQAQVSSD